MSATFKDVAFLASCIASDLATVRRALDMAVGNADMHAVVAVNALVCRAGCLADLLGQAAGWGAVEGGATDWSLTDGEAQHLAALRAKVQQGGAAG
jgi:hypothetical protein